MALSTVTALAAALFATACPLKVIAYLRCRFLLHRVWCSFLPVCWSTFPFIFVGQYFAELDRFGLTIFILVGVPIGAMAVPVTTFLTTRFAAKNLLQAVVYDRNWTQLRRWRGRH